MEFMLKICLSSFIILGVSACPDIETVVGYDNDAVELVFNVDASADNVVYQVTRTNVENTLNLVTALFDNGGSLDALILNGGVKLIGNVSAGNLSFQVPSMNTSFAGVYILKRTTRPQENITCYDLLRRARPNIPVISNSEPDGNSITGIEDKAVTLACRSTGGYPTPTIAWYRSSNQTTPLVTNTYQPQRDDRTYQLEYTFRAVRADDGATFICQSSYDPPDPSYMQTEIKLNLSLKPSTPMLILNNPLQESSNNQVIANCSSAGFKPDSARLTLMLEGSTVLLTANSYPYSSDTFTVTAEYTSTITKTLNGKLLTCSVNHTTLDTPLLAQRKLDVQFAPETATLSGVSSGIVADVKNKITLTCTAGSSNPPSNITWYRNNIKVESNSQIQQTSGEYNGHATSQKIAFEAVRDMDGDEIFCEVHNVVNGDNRLRSDTRTLDLRYHPTITVSDDREATEGEPVTLRCEARAKPAPTFRWYYNGVLISSGSHDSSHINVLNIAAVNRTDVGTYLCRASNGYPPDGIKEIYLTVKYTPDVEVTTTNVTVNASSAQVRCFPSGIPAVYTFAEWQHIWPGVGPIVHKDGLGTSPTLTLRQLTYEYSGIYKCSVSNGIQGSVNPNSGYGVAYLQVETYPIITIDGDFKISGRLNKNTTVTVTFYSNVKDNSVECFIGNMTHACSAVFVDGEVDLPLFDTTIKTSGTLAQITFSITSVQQFGVFNIRISNRIGYSERAVEVMPEGPPQIPGKVLVEETQSNAVVLSWMPGFHGGFNQTFVIEYSTEGQTLFPENTVEIQGGLALRRVNGTVSNLQGGTLYFMRLVSRNEKGNSNYTRVFNVTTELAPDHDALAKNNVLPAVVGSVAVVIAVGVAVVVVLLVRLHSRKHAVKQTDCGNDVYYNIDRPVYDDLRYDGNPHTYSVLGHVGNYEDLTHDTTEVQPYSNIHKDDGSHPAPLVDKTYENLRLSPMK